MPERFKEEPELTEAIDYTDWWKQFNDPLLDTLIDEALCCNLDLRIALRRIEEVRGLYKNKDPVINKMKSFLFWYMETQQ